MPSPRSSKPKAGKHKVPVLSIASTPSSTLTQVPLDKYPAALVSNLAREFPPDYVIGKIKELLEATRWSKDTVVPDFRARYDGVKILLAYGIGLPVQRAEIVVEEPPKVDLMQNLERSPHARNALRRILERSEERAQQAQNQQNGEAPSRA